MKTDRNKLEALFDQLADAMREQLETTVPPASTLNVIRQFLKDNGIEARPVQGSPLGNLVDTMPRFDESEDDGEPIQH